MNEDDPTVHKIRNILKEHAHLDIDIQVLSNDDDLYAAGMTSVANVSVLFALEHEFGITFPDDMLERNLFANVSSIHAAVEKLLNAASELQPELQPAPECESKPIGLTVLGFFTNVLWMSSNYSFLEPVLYVA